MWPGIWARSNAPGLGLRLGQGVHPLQLMLKGSRQCPAGPFTLPLVTPLPVCPARSNDFSKLVAGEYLKFFVFTGMTLDQALRWVFNPRRIALPTRLGVWTSSYASSYLSWRCSSVARTSW